MKKRKKQSQTALKFTSVDSLSPQPESSAVIFQAVRSATCQASDSLC